MWPMVPLPMVSGEGFGWAEGPRGAVGRVGAVGVERDAVGHVDEGEEVDVVAG
jgi:hypothetical protein